MWRAAIGRILVAAILDRSTRALPRGIRHQAIVTLSERLPQNLLIAVPDLIRREATDSELVHALLYGVSAVLADHDYQTSPSPECAVVAA